MDNKHKMMIVVQVLFLVIVITGIYFYYPKTNVDLKDDWATFKTINANVIMLSDNPDFSNPRYIDLSERKNMTYNLKPGTYYWKSDNGVIESVSHKFTINSTVGMEINGSSNESDLINIGNVKINVVKTGDGVMVGHVILEPDTAVEINNSGNYIGRQE
jgi:hypothetical protein